MILLVLAEQRVFEITLRFLRQTTRLTWTTESQLGQTVFRDGQFVLYGINFETPFYLTLRGLQFSTQ